MNLLIAALTKTFGVVSTIFMGTQSRFFMNILRAVAKVTHEFTPMPTLIVLATTHALQILEYIFIIFKRLIIKINLQFIIHIIKLIKVIKLASTYAISLFTLFLLSVNS